MARSSDRASITSGAPALLLLVAAGGAIASGPGPLYLHVVPVSVSQGTRVDPSRPLRVALYVRDPELLAAAIDSEGAVVEPPDRLVIGLSRDPRLAARPGEHTSASFLIDYEDASVRALGARLPADPQTPEQLRSFVEEYLMDDAPMRGWESASRTARLRSGDCTEHAILLAALARARGFPARVIVGTALVAGSEYAAYGHAWTEIFEDGGWQRHDATGIDRVASVHYIPEGVADESPGHALRNAGTMQRLGIQRIAILGNVE